MHTAASRKKAKKHAAHLLPPSRTTPTPFQKNTSCRKSNAARCPHVCAKRKRLLRIAHDTDAKSTPLDEYCRSKNVVAVSPNTLYANLQIILMGLQGMQIEENAKNLRANLAVCSRSFASSSTRSRN